MPCKGHHDTRRPQIPYQWEAHRIRTHTQARRAIPALEVPHPPDKIQKMSGTYTYESDEKPRSHELLASLAHALGSGTGGPPPALGTGHLWPSPCCCTSELWRSVGHVTSDFSFAYCTGLLKGFCSAGPRPAGPRAFGQHILRAGGSRGILRHITTSRRLGHAERLGARAAYVTARNQHWTRSACGRERTFDRHAPADGASMVQALTLVS
jgi:hypothetical protein